MSTPSTVTLQTSDHGPVTIPEPAWCTGHTDHQPDTYRVEIGHKGPEHLLRHHGEVLFTAFLAQAPFAPPGEPSTIGLYIEQGDYAHTLTPLSVYDLAATFEAHADQLRDLADQLAALHAGDGQ
ncbi:DUF6907 domain-containing protein [Streptomyces sediminimaris]|uniref:DUF6907 domain-containing protein n=1 Tax=Streptomyces sediminimaris TaxID=3383721 RepID=UPI00399B5675